MRIVATCLLLAMAAVYIVTRQYEGLHPAVGYIRAFAEAAMVGGLADWFAVTALFRHPLGLPIPHTAIIPENKDRIADTMAAFLQNNFLTPGVVARRMAAVNTAAAAGAFLADPRTGESRLRDGAAGLVADVLESLDPEKLGGLAKGALRGQLEKFELSPLLGQLLGAAIADGRHMPVIESLIRKTAETLEANEALIQETIHERANAILRWTGLDEKLANSILDGLYKLLAETLVVPDHPLRRKIEDGLQTLAHDLVHDPATRAKVEALKREVLANPAFARWLDALWERGRTRLLHTVRNPQGALGGQFGASLAELGHALQRDVQLQRVVNRFARRTMVGVATRYGAQIVRLVSETVKRWDARTVTDRIEGAVGRDLQFIRINGTLVGGLVGLLLHVLDSAM
ncbi:MAG: hypothetical protein B7Y36_06220 [Novosphingobium sp. 28-62-57]|uniref:DUF445 domain-containing protein n=1 Tax=unclassified Novosphingobium TaxID=2644732 RepID=UPI000BD8795F|nr:MULTISPECIES: DUF445 domain-containing protein [unclassified Novosphingobium]OYW50478.1 MAG: hypothetical protein B7Z34_04695 [Novosphingobium sp. 12-62-10]OYZ11839.1 MAG: hypothetical protein B7Y36_06220 [Novosphingobium sp. 28-62-57]OZA30327.1 MAG: hypothetical protein B7X92_16120 [Novosphingobium sp. 17-62-9]HQS69936.1 DUF445 domain-containing protein [Novosphingobium sp.]